MNYEQDLEALIQAVGRPCSLALTTPLRERPPLGGSRLLGGSARMLPWEDWPRSEGEPMTCILQVRIDELPFVPEILEPSAWLAMYADVNGDYMSEAGWEIREYPSLEGLVERKAPALQERAAPWRPLHITWRPYQDILSPSSGATALLGPQWAPVWDALPWYRRHQRPRLHRLDPLKYGRRGDLLPYSYHAPRTKIGGFPTLKQHEFENGPSHPAHFLLQIFHDVDFGQPSGQRYDLCDCAITYIGIDDEGEWRVDTQTS